jgi:hypothetical protein
MTQHEQSMKTAWVVAGVFACFGIVPLARPADTQEAAPTNVDSFDSARGVLFPADRALELLKQCSRSRFSTVHETWLPTVEQLSALETAVAEVLARELSRFWGRSDGPHVRDYYRQYSGIVLNGRKVIYVNGFHSNEITFLPGEERAAAAMPLAFRDPDGWRQHPLMVCDGGAYFFGAIYDPESSKVLEFEFNGY